MGGGHEMEGEIAGIDRWDLGAIWKGCGNVGHWKICQGNGGTELVEVANQCLI